MKRMTWTLVAMLIVSGCSSGLAPAPNVIQATQLPATPQPTFTAPTPRPTASPTALLSTPTRLPASPEPAKQRPPFTLGVQPLQSGFQRPVYLTHAGDGSGRLFVVEQAGRIQIITDGGSPALLFLDITTLVDSSANERGLLSVAFHPDYESNGFFFVNYTRRPDGATVIARYRVSSDPNVADPGSATTILTIPQPQANHNGGLVKFGPDGYLYIGMGDGGGAGDQHGTIGNGQDLTSLLGKILRIDVNGKPYSIPASNPFRGRADARPEIWAFGLRNPWRWSFDRRTGDLYIADVGQNAYEEIDFQPVKSSGGENYGWRLMEGKHCFNPSSGCEQAGLTMPVAEYGHGGECSVSGGYVYRGTQYPWLDGLYFFADYCSGRVWTLSHDPSRAWGMVERAQVDLQTSSFGEDQAGELYLVGHNDGIIYRLISTAL